MKCGQLKKFVVPDPSVTYQRLQPGDEYVIIGSDGLWDVVYPNTAASMVGFFPSACLMRVRVCGAGGQHAISVCLLSLSVYVLACASQAGLSVNGADCWAWRAGLEDGGCAASGAQTCRVRHQVRVSCHVALAFFAVLRLVDAR